MRQSVAEEPDLAAKDIRVEHDRQHLLRKSKEFVGECRIRRAIEVRWLEGGVNLGARVGADLELREQWDEW